ncbi:PhoH family protein [Priestia sp. SB1]|uniref:PhoH family protein n=1 Tax=Priestia sp. SB1 TaxID=3132359 RepID=UPI00316E69E6
MEKIYLLDTNILLADANSINSFGEHTVAIPSTVIQEVDSKKRLMDEVGRNARHVSKELDKLRKKGKLHDGVDLDNGGKLIVLFPPSDSPIYDQFMDKSNDTIIIATALDTTNKNEDKEVILVSKDVLVRVKADVIGVKAEDYQNDKVLTASDDSYTGFTELEVDSEYINEFYTNKKIIAPQPFCENHYVLLKCGNQSAITRYNHGHLNKLYSYTEKPVFGLTHKNIEQVIALDLLLDPKIPLVTLRGKAGTGKTLLALAAGLSQSQDYDTYNKVSAARPIVPLGNDIGFLPGEKEEKLKPWMQPILDNLEFLFDCKDQQELEQLLTGYEGMIQVEALTYIRGRSIPNQFIIIDEAQNLSKHEAKTILTRLGAKSKVVLTGDPDQIDHPYLDAYSNGLTYVIEKFKEYSQAGHITLTKGERSEFAQLAADIL